ncbi:aldehyde dehydrogenase family protein [Planotetraspora sp. GP83]|uniref:aldehyde dehydrogenase family protein n=1 Tax=Planotetraspora sp. GP83 TaxID=3156264 RepID=UPI0035188FBA
MSATTSFSPRDGQIAGSVPDTRPEGVTAAVARALEAAPRLASVPPAQRSDWLRGLADALDEHSEELAELADKETALGAERLTGEVGRAAGQLRFYGEVAREGSYLGVTLDEATGTSPRLVRVNRPLGPVAVFGASNFPFAFGVLGNDTASAVAAGCPVVVKAHPAHVLLSVRLAEIATDTLDRAGAPYGTFSLVVGQQAGADLVRADGVAAVAFTGSQSGGLALWRIANERPRVIPVYAEMGTINPVVVTRAATHRMEEVARGFVGSFTLGAGQFCTKPGVLFVPSGHGFPRAVGDALAEAAPDPVMLTRAIAESVTGGLGDLFAAGAKIVRKVGGTHAGWSAEAAVLTAPIAALRPGSRLLEECFGPVALVVEYDTDEELLSALTRLQGGLAASVMTGDGTDPDAARLVDVLTRSAGRVAVNDWPTGVAYTWAQHHGGPWPATSNPAATSVGAAALGRFVRPVAYQSAADEWLPPEARSGNPWTLPRRVNGRLETRTAEPS